MWSKYRQMYWSWREISSWKTNSLYLQMILKLDTFPHLSVLFQLCLMHMQNIHEPKYKQSLSNHTLELLQFQGLSN